MTTAAGSSLSATRSWENKRPKQSVLDVVQGLAQQYAVPIVLIGFLVRRYLAHRKKNAASKSEDKTSGAEPPASASATRKPRRDYKVKRDQEAHLLVGADDEDVEVQPHDNVMEAYDEKEVEKAGAASAGPGGSNTAMLQMLQQMGYKIIMPKDGSGQVFLVPPGAAGPGGQAIAEGDDEGYDEDEEGYEEGEEEEEDGDEE